MSNIFAQFYANIKINVDNSGFVDINGDTNYNNFLNITNSQIFTSNKKDVWTLNISSQKNESFSSFIYELILPKNSQIYYMKTTPTFRIENENSKIKIIGTGSNKPFTLIVQYKLLKTTPILKNNLVPLLIIFLIIILGIIIYFGKILLIKEKNKEKNIKTIQEEVEEVLEETELLNPNVKNKIKKYDLNMFSKRQQKIIELLLKNGTQTQNKLNDSLKIPKSSLSRNIKSLEIKKIISIEEKGRYNLIILNKRKLN